VLPFYTIFGISNRDKTNKAMKITITLTKGEVSGLKRYMAAGDVGFQTPSHVKKQNIQAEISNIVKGIIHNPAEAMADFINEECDKLGE
jgi:hypothetical protein